MKNVNMTELYGLGGGWREWESMTKDERTSEVNKRISECENLINDEIRMRNKGNEG